MKVLLDSSEVFEMSLTSRVEDFKDAVVEAVSIKNRIDVIINRNMKGLKYARIFVKTRRFIAQKIFILVTINANS